MEMSICEDGVEDGGAGRGKSVKFIDAIGYCKCKITNILTVSPTDSIKILE